jgi:hypothetical protein
MIPSRVLGSQLTGRLLPMKNLIQSSGYPPLEIAKCWKYMEAGLREYMKYSELISPVLSASFPSTLSNFFTLVIKVIGGGFLVNKRMTKRGAVGN